MGALPNLASDRRLALQAQRICVRYPSLASASGRQRGVAGRGQVPGTDSADVLQDVNLDLFSGELVVVIGPNGAGKSTLVRVLSGVLTPHAGVARLFGEDLARLSRRNIARRLAVVPQATEVPIGFRVEEVVLMGRSPHQGLLQVPTAEDRHIAARALGRAGVEHLVGRRVETLSGGEQKLVTFARALAQEPEVLLLDEAAAHLDPRHAIGLYELVRSEARERGVACLAIGHDVNLAAAFADRVVLMKDGAVLAGGAVEEVMTLENLERAFGANLQIAVDGADARRYFVPRPRASGSRR
jgi:iron complex transport system ATP-binding protein